MIGTRYRLLFENMPQGAALYELCRDADGQPADWRVLEVNDAYTRHTGLARERVAGRRMGEVFPEAVPAYLPRFARVVASQTPESYEAYAPSVGRHLAVSVLPAGGDCFATIVTDATDRMRLEAERQGALDGLVRSNRDLEQFAYVSSHDLQEPLRGISVFVTLLQERAGSLLDEQSREFLRKAVLEIGRVRALIDDLAEYCRAGSGAAGAGPVSGRETLDEALGGLRPLIAETGAVVEASELPSALADRAELALVFRHLIGNAIRYHRPGTPPRVRVEARGDGDVQVFSVHDNGVGIPPEQFERIFLIFQRLHGRGRPGGTGIGLPIVRRIVEAHGGRVWVESCVGAGSTFSFTLRAADAPAPLG